MILTEKEIKVLKLRKKGLTQIEIAKSLSISQAAVSNFENNAKKKVGDAKVTLRIVKEIGLASLLILFLIMFRWHCCNKKRYESSLNEDGLLKQGLLNDEYWNVGLEAGDGKWKSGDEFGILEVTNTGNFNCSIIELNCGWGLN